MKLPHPLNRKYQKEAYERIANSKAKFVICKLATGIGKTALAAQLAVDGQKVLANVMTKSLQWQYVDPYQFTPLFGKNNYACEGMGQQQELFGDRIELTADLCECPKEFKDDCRKSCPYPLARSEFIASQAGIINYAKFISDRALINSTIITKGFDPNVLVFDEAHELDDFTIDRAGAVFSWSSKRLMQYCQPLEDIDSEKHFKELSQKMPEPMARQRATVEAVEKAMDWLGSLLGRMKSQEPLHPAKSGDIYLYKWWKNKLDQVDLILGCMEIEPRCWFVKSDNEGFTVKPKTARFHFKQLFDKAPKIVMMSATIQPKDIEALGIDNYEFIAMPNPIPPQDRPVYDLKAPAITWKSNSSEYKQHAQILSDTINSTPDDWTSLVLFPSKKKSEDWAEMIHTNTRRPVYVPERGLPTDEGYQKWLEYKDRHAGAVCCAWQFWTGVDAGYLNSVIVGDVPYPNFGDPFEKARFDFDPGSARVRVANAIEQGLGRNRRGDESHYGEGASKLNCIAGGSKFSRLRSAFDKDFWSSIR